MEYITTPDARDAAISILKGCSVIGVDTEGDSLFSYKERVSLIQISGGEKHYVFDPLLLDSVLPLASILEDRSILKILHGADYDVASMRRDFGFKIGPIFDTTLAARAVGIEKYSLQDLVKRYFQETLSKKYQKADWSYRPIPREQLDYAFRDTFFLVPLYQILKKEVEKKGREDQIAEECRLLEEITWNGKTFEPNDYLRIKGAKPLPPVSQRVLRELAVARDRLAKESNRPSFKVISNWELLTIAKSPPQDEAALARLFPRESSSIRKNKSRWLEAVSKGLTSTVPLPGKEKRSAATVTLTRDEEKRLAGLKAWRNKQAALEGLEPSMVISSSILKVIAKEKPETLEGLDGILPLRKWQIKRYGTLLINEISRLVSSSKTKQ
ncbi:MAG: ribonuclease D [Nitrospiria bacterium]